MTQESDFKRYIVNLLEEYYLLPCECGVNDYKFVAIKQEDSEGLKAHFRCKACKKIKKVVAV